MNVSGTAPPTALPDLAHLAQAKIVVPEHLVYRTFVSETIVLNLKTGTYHGLNVTAGRMLELLQRTGDFAQTADKLVAEYNLTVAEINRDLRALCGELLQRGLIELA
jgi:hypothetical protein